LGRLLLSRPNPAPDSVERAKQELQKELGIDPHNAAAEYVLGELARQENQWPEAIDHFRKATQFDAAMPEAQLGLGITLVADGKAEEAIAPLEIYVKSQPGDPAGHYHLAMAYSRAGRKEDAKREAALQREAAAKIEQEKKKAADAQRQQQTDGQRPPS
jgi:predicted Zn-dependent protease